MSDSRPNILFIMPDQHRGDCLSLERHPAVLTPNIDAIGGAGTHFRRAYTTCPSCIPARRCLLTGQYPSTNGMVGMQSGYGLTAPTLPGELRAAGYQTVLIGRNMHQTPDTARYGYDHMVLGSVYVLNDDYAVDLLNFNGERGARSAGISNNGWTARPWHLDESAHPTNWIVRQSRRFLETHDETAPLFLTTSFYSPHPPLLPPAFYMDRYLRMDLPPAAIGDWEEPPPNDGLGLAVDSPRIHLKGEMLRSAQAGYYGLINHIDDQLYWLISEFKARQPGAET